MCGGDGGLGIAVCLKSVVEIEVLGLIKVLGLLCVLRVWWR